MFFNNQYLPQISIKCLLYLETQNPISSIHLAALSTSQKPTNSLLNTSLLYGCRIFALSLSLSCNLHPLVLHPPLSTKKPTSGFDFPATLRHFSCKFLSFRYLGLCLFMDLGKCGYVLLSNALFSYMGLFLNVFSLCSSFWIDETME